MRGMNIAKFNIYRFTAHTVYVVNQKVCGAANTRRQDVSTADMSTAWDGQADCACQEPKQLRGSSSVKVLALLEPVLEAEE